MSWNSSLYCNLKINILVQVHKCTAKCCIYMNIHISNFFTRGGSNCNLLPLKKCFKLCTIMCTCTYMSFRYVTHISNNSQKPYIIHVHCSHVKFSGLMDVRLKLNNFTFLFPKGTKRQSSIGRKKIEKGNFGNRLPHF